MYSSVALSTTEVPQQRTSLATPAAPAPQGPLACSRARPPGGTPQASALSLAYMPGLSTPQKVASPRSPAPAAPLGPTPAQEPAPSGHSASVNLEGSSVLTLHALHGVYLQVSQQPDRQTGRAELFRQITRANRPTFKLWLHEAERPAFAQRILTYPVLLLAEMMRHKIWRQLAGEESVVTEMASTHINVSFTTTLQALRALQATFDASTARGTNSRNGFAFRFLTRNSVTPLCLTPADFSITVTFTIAKDPFARRYNMTNIYGHCFNNAQSPGGCYPITGIPDPARNSPVGRGSFAPATSHPQLTLDVADVVPPVPSPTLQPSTGVSQDVADFADLAPPSPSWLLSGSPWIDLFDQGSAPLTPTERFFDALPVELYSFTQAEDIRPVPTPDFTPASPVPAAGIEPITASWPLPPSESGASGRPGRPRKRLRHSLLDLWLQTERLPYVASIEKIQRVCADFHGVERAIMTLPTRTVSRSWPRQVAIYFAAALSDKTRKAIGDAFGQCSQSYVTTCVQNVTEQRKANPRLDQQLTDLQRILTEN